MLVVFCINELHDSYSGIWPNYAKQNIPLSLGLVMHFLESTIANMALRLLLEIKYMLHDTCCFQFFFIKLTTKDLDHAVK